MANPGVGTKFVSVNLNKSYGQTSHTSHHQNSYGSGRTRPGGHGGGGMVVLSRPRSSHKTGPKLSVPPPLNLPSLRKEHERFDLTGSGGGVGGTGVSGSGSRPSSSVAGWVKPGGIAFGQKDPSCEVHVDGVDEGLHSGIGVGGRNSTSFIPPSDRTAVARSVPVHHNRAVEKVSVLRGEDFPSLRAASGPAHKNGLSQKQKQIPSEDVSNEQRDSSQVGSLAHMRSRLHSSSQNLANGFGENGSRNHGVGHRVTEPAKKKEEYFPSPLPLMKLNPRFDWADDERDTGHGFSARGKDQGFLKNESYWDRDFDIPRANDFSQKQHHNHFDRKGHRDNEVGKVYSGEVRDVREGHGGNSWRSSSAPKVGFSGHGVGNFRNDTTVKPLSMSREIIKEDKFSPSSSRDNGQTGFNSRLNGDAVNWNSSFVKRDAGCFQGGRQQWSNMGESYGSRVADRNVRDCIHSEQYNRYRGDNLENCSAFKASLALGSKGLPVAESVSNFCREKHSHLKSAKPYFEDPFLKDFTADFDGRNLFSNRISGVVKRKKDMSKQMDFYDPVRESFEAELERVQKMQEQERQQIIEEQERVLELARREEEERVRLAREEEEQQRRMEEEAREAARRAEQDQLDAIRRAEEHKIAREEEKRRIAMEEERRKEAAKQKLLELEARMARRQAEAAKNNTDAISDDKIQGMANDIDALRISNIGDLEQDGRVVQKIAVSASSDGSCLNNYFENGPRPHLSEDGPAFVDRGKPSWRRDVYEHANSLSFLPQEQDNDHHSHRPDTSFSGRAFPREEFYGGSGFMPSRNCSKGCLSDPHMDDFTCLKRQGWKYSGGGDHYGRNPDLDLELNENIVDRFGDVGWGVGHPRGNLQSFYPERLYQNTETDELHSGKPRYSMKQPRVLPPPSLCSMQKNINRVGDEHNGRSSFINREMMHNHASGSMSSMQVRADYDDEHINKIEQCGMVDAEQENTETVEQKLDGNITSRCDSQSSLSVSSAPNSPSHLSHDELDVPAEPLGLLGAPKGKDGFVPGNDSAAVIVESGTGNTTTLTNSSSAAADEEWTVENNEQLHEQEEYDEVEDGYLEEDEVHEGNDEHIDLTEKFGAICLEEKGSSNMIENPVRGFNEGIEVRNASDDLERSTKNEELIYAVSQVSVCSVEVQGSCDGTQSDGQVHSIDAHSNQSSSTVIEEREKSMQSLIGQHTVVFEAGGASELLHNVGASSSSVLPAFGQASSSVNMSCSQTDVSAAVTSPTEVPVKLQFGLFSGPSLIPSPVPAIQIGSIQMPLHIHPQVGPSLPHIHPSQPPLFQFGQMRYTSSLPQGILSLKPQSVPYVHSSVPSQFSPNQKGGCLLPVQPNHESSQNLGQDAGSQVNDIQAGPVAKQVGLPQKVASNKASSLLTRDGADANIQRHQVQLSMTYPGRSNAGCESGSREDNQLQPQSGGMPSWSTSKERGINVSRAPGTMPSGRGRRFFYTIKSSNSRSPFTGTGVSHSDSNGFQKTHARGTRRTEFRVRENGDRRQSAGLLSPNLSGQDSKLNFSGRGSVFPTRNGCKKGPLLSLKHTSESDYLSPCQISSREIESENRADKMTRKGASMKSRNSSCPGDENLKRSSCTEQDTDAPLRSGIVRVCEQPGIETPSDYDDFIEVRSKRQMLNDRREQREREIKAKSQIAKAPRKLRSTSEGAVVSSGRKVFAPANGVAATNHPSDFVSFKGRDLENAEVSAGFNTIGGCQPLAPIGTPAGNADVLSDMRSQTTKSVHTTSSTPVISSIGKDLGPSLTFGSHDGVLDCAQTSLSSWNNTMTSQQVMALTQSQLDEAMRPVQFDVRASSVGDHVESTNEPSMPSSSILSKDKSFASAPSPINSLLAGEKIKFGAVTSPTILPPSSRAVSHGIGPSCSGRSDTQTSHNLVENECSLFYGEDKHTTESRTHLEDSEAEAAASAVAVAAISSEEIIGNGSTTCPLSVPDVKSFGEADPGVSGDRPLAGQSRVEESLSVALPADLSVETPPISWPPPLHGLQTCSSQMLSHFPGGPQSHFPIYEMNPMLRSPIFAFGPHDESASNQLQSQNSASGLLGTWQQCNSGADSFYGPPSGFTGPFISPPGVQGPAHMVVYNHFAPVGQFGQVGLSFMGTTYIPSGKQPDWKHDSSSSAMGIGDGETNNMNSIHRTLPPPVQHLAPGSPLLPLASPLAMFDLSPFQSSPDMAVQGRWSGVPASPLHSGPLSPPLQRKPESIFPSLHCHGPPPMAMNQSLNVKTMVGNRYSISRTQAPSENGRGFSVSTDATVTHFPDELEPVHSAGATNLADPIQSTGSNNAADAAPAVAVEEGSQAPPMSGFKNHACQQKVFPAQQPHGQGTSYSHQRGGGSDWTYRRMGFHGRNQQSLGFHSGKVKQIYVAKQTSNGRPET